MTRFIFFREGVSRSRKNSREAAISVLELFPVETLEVTIRATLSLVKKKRKKKEAKCETDKNGRRLGAEIS